MFLVKPHERMGEKPRSYARPPVERPTKCAKGLNGKDWKYVAEGGANVLFRLQSPSTCSSSKLVDINFYGKLLRIKKCDINVPTLRKRLGGKADSDSNAIRSCQHRRSVKKPGLRQANYPQPQQVLEYATHDILPYLEEQLEEKVSMKTKGLVGSNYIQVAELVEVETRFLLELNEQLLSLDSRPAHRRSSQIDVSLSCVMLLPDVTLPPPDNSPLLFFEHGLMESRSQHKTIGKVSVSGHSNMHSTRDEEFSPCSSEQATDEETGDDGGSEIGSNDGISRTLSLADNDDVFAASESVSRSSSRTNTESEEMLHPSSLCSDHDSEADVEEYDDDCDNGEYKIDSYLQRSSVSPPRLRRQLSVGNRNIFDCCFRNICVEIKPKIGFTPKGPWVADVKKNVCRFCMHQHYKKSMGQVEELSEYCPLDLFSQDPVRVRKALCALQRTPQNNFKVFVRSTQDEVVNVITGLSTDALPKGASQAHYAYCHRKRLGFRHSCQSIGYEDDLEAGSIRSPQQDHVIPEVVELMSKVLLKLGILQDLKKMQLLDHINVDGMWHLKQLLHRVEHAARDGNQQLLLEVLVQRIRNDETYSADDECAEKVGSLARCLAILEYTLQELRGTIRCVEHVASWHEVSLGGLQELYEQLLQRFRVATTLKDCSLLLCLRRIDGSNSKTPVGWDAWKAALDGSTMSPPFEHLREYEHRISFRDMEFDCIVAVVDLDVKAHKSVDDYFQLDAKIVESFVKEVGPCAVKREWCRED